MKTRSMVATTIVAALLVVNLLSGSAALAADTPFQASRVTVESSKSFEEVTKALTGMVTKNDMMVMADVDQGNMLSMTGLKLKAHLYLIGSPTVGKKLFEQDHNVGLYVPIRVLVNTDANNKTIITYDKPSSLMSQFDNEQIGMVAKMLDKKIESLAKMASK